MYYIEDVKIGQSFTHSLTVTEEIHDQFCQLSGDDSPIHTNEEFCQKTKFKKRVGYAFLLTAVLSKVYGTVFPGGSELCLKQTCNFKRPFFIGDLLSFEIEVSHKNVSTKIITVKNRVKNQENSVIFTGEGILQLSLGIV
jgi:3-hydroxybutyryl-CoA dehydratase